MGEQIYLTDNPQLRKLLQEKVLQKKKGRGAALLKEAQVLYFPADFFYTQKLEKEPNFARVKTAAQEGAVLYNGFEPTAEGQERFSYFMEKIKVKNARVYNLKLSCAGNDDYSRFLPIDIPEAEKKELKNWICMKIDNAISKRLSEKGLHCPYSCRLFPLLYEIEKREREIEAADQFCITAKIQIGEQVFKGSLCDADGSILKLSEDELNLSALRQLKNGEIVEIEKNDYESLPPPLYDYVELLEVISESTLQADLAMDHLYQLYRNHLITFPKTTSKFLSAAAEKILLPEEINFPPYDEIAKKLIYGEPSTVAESDYTGGIAILSEGQFAAEYMNSQNADFRPIYDLLLQRQLMQFCEPYKAEKLKLLLRFENCYFLVQTENIKQLGWKAIEYGVLASEQIKFIEKEPVQIVGICKAKAMLPVLHHAKSLIQLLKVHAAGSREEIVQIMQKLVQHPFVGRYHNYYILHQNDAEVVENMPKELLSMEIYSLIDSSCQRAQKSGVRIEDYKRTVNEAIAKYCERL
ncbi:DNA topoisomerase [Emergencia sp. 1XD21-10]|uniref:DNA topoisomerase n=1 Tax=Emergencia sp. 1XD21-10 TaxID=2304569 RepID=UPI00137B9310|nr:DNA topoisomerase [Emergencia sp. 1XD21-10]NCE98107.1 type IA DNA topoisomerase [Emergencia sp. 1XD21-10]